MVARTESEKREKDVIDTAVKDMKSGDRLAVSVVIPTYNREALVPRAVASVVAQCLDGDEVIVVDDGSTDNTEAALLPYRDRILYLRVTNGGAGRARNIGIKAARNPLVAFLDSDDEWLPGKLELQRSLMQAREDIVFSFTDMGCCFSSGKEIHRYFSCLAEHPRIYEAILGSSAFFSSIAPLPDGRDDFLVYVGNVYPAEMEPVYSHISACTLMVRSGAAGDSLWFAEDLPTYEDWVCFGKLARKGPAAYLDCETTRVYRHEGPQLTKADELTNAAARIAVLTRVWGQDLDYLAEYGDSYNRVLRQQRLIRIRELLALARTREARLEMRHLSGAPFSYRVLACLPAVIARMLLATRRHAKKLLKLSRG
jgi:glycosyltransferase involved in cell wall biosynthesis